ncbi:MAG: hypothetical protein ACRDRK_19520 [Pseudonocardia sp.]
METHTADAGLIRRHVAELLADMPDVWRRALGQHSPDAAGRCLECRDVAGAARWPCLPNRIATEARQISEAEH